MKTEQETYDQICRHAITMEKPSMTGDTDQCRYRLLDGNRCLAGALIPDDKYNPAMEGSAATSVPTRSILLSLGYDPYFVFECQLTHDLAAKMGESFKPTMLKRLKVLGQHKGLSTKVLDEYEEGSPQPKKG